MKAIVALMCLAVASAVEYSADWQEWKDLHGKTYECEHEELARYTVYVANKAYIEEHNKNADAHGYTLKMNEFGDLVRPDPHVYFLFHLIVLGCYRVWSSFQWI